MERSLKYFKGIIALILTGLIFTLIACGHRNNSDYKEISFDAIDIDPSLNAKELVEKSYLINKSGDFHRGFKYLNRAVALDPVAHLGYRGWIRLRKLRDFDQALADFNRLDSLTPGYVDAPWGEDIDFLRGECYFGNKQYYKAVKSFHKSLKNQKEGWADVQAYVYLGICQYKLGNYDQGIVVLKEGLNQYDKICEAHYWLAKIYQTLNKMDSAREHIQKARDLIAYKRDDIYNEYLNEIYIDDIISLKQQLEEKQ